ncbi:MAG TPA: PepSY domain-containing protein [Tissierellaceae bacterium]|nr:PepSY domain-containing protein [Tissierellaceae bacterium]
MFKKRWILPLILVLALSLTACADNPPEDENPINQEEDEVTDTNNQNNNQDNNDIENDEDNDDQDSLTQNNNEEDIRTEYELGNISKEDAYDAFVEEYPGIKVHKIEIDESDGDYFYKVKGYDGTKKYKIKMNMKDGAKSTEEENDNETEREEITKEHLEKIEELLAKTLDDARDGYMIDEWELKSKDEGFIFEVEIIDENKDNELEYEYNLESGELLEIDD